jgi:hypothetical protein
VPQLWKLNIRGEGVGRVVALRPLTCAVGTFFVPSWLFLWFLSFLFVKTSASFHLCYLKGPTSKYSQILRYWLRDSMSESEGEIVEPVLVYNM